MWRYILLIALPPLAIVLNHDIISFVMLVGWTAGVIPLCLLHALDVFRDPNRSKTARNILRLPVFLLGLTSFGMGASIVVWCLYNVFVRMLPEYTGPRSVVELALGGFGISFILISFGWYLMALAFGKRDRTYDVPNR